MRKLLLVLAVAFFSMPAWAQENLNLEIGVKGGIGDFSNIDDTPGDRGVFGLEVCAFCGGKYAMFGDYQHFLKPNNGRTGYGSADSFSGGLRIQGRRKVSPFLDLGIAVGTGRYDGTSLTSVGAAFGTGLRVPLGQRAYVRPQLRLHFLDHGIFSGAAEVAVGWRF